MEDEYDEFGNYIGPEISTASPATAIPNERAQNYGQSRDFDGVSEDGDFNGRDADEDRMESVADDDDMQLDAVIQRQNQIILHEDKKYYPDAEEVFGPEVEALVQEEDTMMLSEPIIAPIKKKSFELAEKDLPQTTFKKEFLFELTKYPEFIRNVSIVGHLHHGKTWLIDNLIQQTHSTRLVVGGKNEHSSARYTDIHHLERDRGISIKSQPVSLVLQTSKSKSYLFNMMDTPGHADFIDEVCASTKLSDGAILVVDVVEGVMLSTRRVIRQLVMEQIPIILFINKIDRLPLELKLPPLDAYFKLKHTIEEVNSIISSYTTNIEKWRLSPERGNVCFGSTQYGFLFSLKSFAAMYQQNWGIPVDTDSFSKRLWGEIYFNEESNTFTRKPKDPEAQRSFVHFIMDPLYKIFSLAISKENHDLQSTFRKLGIVLKKAALKADIKPLLREICLTFFGDFRALVDCCVSHLPSPLENATAKIESFYTGPLNSKTTKAMAECRQDGPVVLHVCKLYPTDDRKRFDALARIYCGKLETNQRLRVLGESYTADDEEDMSIQEISNLWIYESRYRFDIPSMTAGNWVLIGGVDETIGKTATLVSMNLHSDEDAYIFRPLKFPTTPIVKIAIEPLHPSELPKMLDGLRRVTKSYPMLFTKVEESGEHILLGPGEMYMDCVMHDLRVMYTEIEIRVSDPVVKFNETVVETSSLKCFAETPNKKNKISIIAEPLEKEIVSDIENGLVNINGPRKDLESFFGSKYNWDLLACRGLWAFGPDDMGPNILINDTLPGEVDPKLLSAVKDSVKQGFQWGTREGPLCDEQVRNVKFKILDLSLAAEPIYRGGGQIIPTTRRVVYSSFLTATPRLLEPVYHVEIQTPSDCISAVYAVLQARRGHVVQDLPKAGSPLYCVKALLPVIDSFGFEVDLRTRTQGMATCQMAFDHWQMVPGDPLDRNIVLRPLEKAPASHLARDFLVKTRNRKGLSEDVSVGKYFEDSMLLELAKQDILLGTSLL